jgi:hypothetical protein
MSKKMFGYSDRVMNIRLSTASEQDNGLFMSIANRVGMPLSIEGCLLSLTVDLHVDQRLADAL